MKNNIDDKVYFLCPKCRTTLTYSREYINFIDNLDIKCPACGVNFKGKARLSMPHDEVHAEGNIEKQEAAPEENNVESPEERQEDAPEGEADVPPGYRIVASLLVKENFSDQECKSPCGVGESYPIVMDRTLIGRKSNSGHADIQIPSNRFMSRDHIIVVKSGNQYRLECGECTNAPKVNNMVVEKGKSVILHNGDEITLGKTVIEWRCQYEPEEKSIVLDY